MANYIEYFSFASVKFFEYSKRTMKTMTTEELLRSGPDGYSFRLSKELHQMVQKSKLNVAKICRTALLKEIQQGLKARKVK